LSCELSTGDVATSHEVKACQAIALGQLVRVILGWEVSVDLGWGMFSMPFWPNWVTSAVFAMMLAWLGFAVARGTTTAW